MKKIFNQLWSCWNKTDRIIAIFSIIALIIICCTIFSSCNAQTLSPSVELEELNPYITDSIEIDNNYIPIYADGVIDFIYCTQDEEYIIEYMDDDYFDLENLPQTINCVANTDTNYVCIYCSEEIFFDYLQWYNSTDKNSFYSPHPDYYIAETWCGDNKNSYWYYKLIKR